MRSFLSFLFLLASLALNPRAAAQTTGSDGFLVRIDLTSCTYVFSGFSQSFGSTGSTGQVSLTTQAGCGWNAASSDPFVTITSNSAGATSAVITFIVAANPSSAARAATITAGGQSLTVNQAGAPCTYTLSATSVTIPASGGSGSVAVTTPIGCTWNSSSNAAWLSAVIAGGAVNYTVNANSSTVARTGTITIAGQSFTVSQDGALLVAVPAVISVSPAYSGGATQTLVLQFSDADGYQDLDVVNLLINNYLDGRQACHLAYSRTTNVLYIVPDNGDGSQVTGKVMDGTGTVSNSQCTVLLANSSAVGNGSTLTLTLSLNFTTSFAATNGSKVLYAAARDVAQHNSGWRMMGAHLVPGAPAAYPRPLAMSPASGAGPSQTLSFTFQDQVSATNLQTVWVLMNSAVDSAQACSVAYYRPGNQLYLRPDSGDPAQASIATLGTAVTLQNSACAINMATATASINGSTLTLTLPMTFGSPFFAGTRNAWLAVQTLTGAVSQWQALGTWVIP